MNTSIPDTVVHREQDGRGEFFIDRDGRRIAELTYSMHGDAAVAGHTWVDPSLRGGQLAPSLLQALATWARAEGRKVIPMCSYVRSAFSRSTQYDDIWQK